ncbi:MAG: glycosyltransferase family 4 protein [Lachnospiraceae bacterium]|nr:glycosyltransferase family 4 protein [Lachnospiraceae bacterium]
MTLTFVSNYINHHQLPVAGYMYDKLGDGYHFIQTEEVEEERVSLGWQADFNLPYLVKSYEDDDRARELIANSDIVLMDDCVSEDYINDRIEAGKIVIRLAERCYKEGQWKAISPRGLIYKNKVHTKRADKPVYLLCEGGYVADDYEIFKAYRGKRYKWGYFPEFRECTYDKDDSKLNILWAGRLINWKHPEIAIKGAKYLKDKGIDFSLDIVGTGNLGGYLEKMVKELRAQDKVTFSGSLPYKEVRERMLKSQILLCTSDYEEGWGAVVNEGLNSRCAVLASHAMGATPFLIKHEKNGLVFKSEDQNDFNDKLYALATNADLRRALSDEGYNTIASLWNANVAAERLLTFAKGLMNGEIKEYEDGPMSVAEAIHQNKMYDHLVNKG